MSEALFYLASNFWLGASHAVLPGHGKTVAAAYVVGARGRPKDAVTLGILVTLSHTSGVVLLFVALASIGTTFQLPERSQTWLGLATGLVVTAVGLWMLRSRRDQLLQDLARPADVGHGHEPSHRHAEDLGEHPHGDPGRDREHDHAEAAAHGHDPARGRGHDDQHGHPGADDRAPAELAHRHGWGRRHTHRIDAVAGERSSLPGLVGIAVADGLLPDPAALGLLISAMVKGKVLLGLTSVVAYSVGFAAVLAAVGIVAAIAGQIVVKWLSGRWIGWLQTGAALLVVVVGVVLTLNAWRRM
jgi:nickel/cobalt exporter